VAFLISVQIAASILWGGFTVRPYLVFCSGALPIKQSPVVVVLMGIGGLLSPTFAAAGSICLEGFGLPAFPNLSDAWPRFRFLPDAIMLANCFGGVVASLLAGSL
jgi:hypothetical protein